MSIIRTWGRFIAAGAVILALVPAQALVAGPLFRDYTTIPNLFFRSLRKVMGFQVDFKGEEIVKDKPAVYIANHLSEFDPLFLGGDLSGAFVGKSVIGSWALIGAGARAAQMVLIQRDKKFLPQAWEMVTNVIRAGRNLIVFPEGTVSDGTNVRQFKAGLMRFMFNEESRPKVQDSLPPDLVVQPFAMRVKAVAGKTVEEEPSLRTYFSSSAGSMDFPYLKNPSSFLQNAWNILQTPNITVEVTALPPLNPREFSNAQELMNTARRMVADIVAPGMPEPPPHILPA